MSEVPTVTTIEKRIDSHAPDTITVTVEEIGEAREASQWDTGGNRGVLEYDPNNVDPPVPEGLVPSNVEPEWSQVTKAFLGSIGSNLYNGVKSLVTGEAGRALGERAVDIVENQTGKEFTGTAGEYLRWGRAVAGDIVGTNFIVEGAYGYDISNNEALNTEERIIRTAGGVGALAGTLAGGLSTASRLGNAASRFAKPKVVTGAADAVDDAAAATARTKQLGRGSTADLSKGTTLARNLREQLAIEQALSRPAAGQQLPLKLTDPRWSASEGWVKMQQVIQSGGREGPINVHYVYNTITGAIDDAKIVLPGRR